MKSAAVVFRKEMLEILRDRRTLIAIALAALALTSGCAGSRHRPVETPPSAPGPVQSRLRVRTRSGCSMVRVWATRPPNE